MNDYASPRLDCDLVLKGGITSGIVYPSAIRELAQTYRFHCIGGTSAGAIAAATAAAAEHGRRHARGGAAFEELAQLPNQLGANVGAGRGSRLFSLFQPQPATRPLFDLVVAVLGRVGKLRTVVTIVAAYRSAVAAVSIVAALASAGLALWAASDGGAVAAIAVLAPMLVLSLIAIAAAIAVAIVSQLRRAVPDNFYGLCNGSTSADAGPDTPGLTPWLSSLIHCLAGQPAGRPLTFGDLWGEGGRDKTDVDLQMMTTSLTHGRPYRLPFSGTEENLFSFKASEFAQLFPPDVVAWLLAHSPTTPEQAAANDGLYRLPPSRDVPIVVAARMSLSFPVLLSAVPLYAVDFGRPGGRRPYERCWFSDGGICSNFPVHLFDAPLPRWPTFSINLRPYHRDYPDRHVYKVESNSGGQDEWWSEIDEAPAGEPSGKGGRIARFLVSIIETMQNWSDNTQLKVPGYRDRVVHVSLSPNEGGLNLDMPTPLINTLAGRGQIAARRLAADFAPDADVEVSWDNHRWVRFRTTMGLLAGQLESMRNAQRNPLNGDCSYEHLVVRADNEVPRSYGLGSERRRVFTRDAFRRLITVFEEWEAAEYTFRDDDRPRPVPELRVRPRV